MADSVYTADLFGSPLRGALPVLASDKSHSRNLGSSSTKAGQDQFIASAPGLG